MNVEEVLHDAALYANAAHGPLEGKAVNLESAEGWGKLYTREAVDALVKATGFLARHLRHIGMTRDDEEFIADAEEALKPFVGKAESVADAVAKNDAAVLVHVARCIQKHGLTGNLRAALDEALESFSEAP